MWQPNTHIWDTHLQVLRFSPYFWMKIETAEHSVHVRAHLQVCPRLYGYAHIVIRMQVCMCAAPIEQKNLFTHDWVTLFSLLNTARARTHTLVYKT